MTVHLPARRSKLAVLSLLLAPACLLAPAACSSPARSTATTSASPAAVASPAASSPGATATTPTATTPTANSAAASLLPGMPAPLDPHDLYAADRPGQLSDTVKDFPSRVYVPNTQSDTVSVIDPTTYQVIDTLHVGHQPQHVVPSWDLKTLWVNNDLGNSLTPIDPATGKAGQPVDVHDPYNLYFTPDGKYAIVMASADRQLVFRDAHTMAVVKTVPVDCAGVNHADFSPDGRYFITSCEFSGELLKVDTASMTVLAKQKLPKPDAMPQDVKISPDGRTWYIADMMADGVWVLDGDSFATPTLLPTGKGAHGLYVSRDSQHLYISNRGEGSISLLDFATGKLSAKWQIPGGGSRTWAGSPPTERYSGSAGATTPRSTPSPPTTGTCWPGSRSAPARTGSASTRSPAATRSGTPASSADPDQNR